MIDLEQEFEMLRRLVLHEIDVKEQSNLLSTEEAEGLRVMVAARMTTQMDIPEEERCPHGCAPGCGWSASMGYHCT